MFIDENELTEALKNFKMKELYLFSLVLRADFSESSDIVIL